LDPFSDNAIMLRVKAGDLDMMSLLFERHHRALYGFLFHMTNHREGSEDMTQNVFYRMLKYRHTFNGEGQLTTWMYHLARNVLKDEFKKNSKMHSLEEITESLAGSITEDGLEIKQSKLQLHEAMQLLSKDHREVLTLNRLQELRHKEVADVLQITEGAVKVRVYRAMQELKEIYKKIEY
jgi:RNA polymerase sigma factor (sigma-70 family)